MPEPILTETPPEAPTPDQNRSQNRSQNPNPNPPGSPGIGDYSQPKFPGDTGDAPWLDPEPVASEFQSKPEFRRTFQDTFNIASLYGPLAPLKIEPEEKESAEAAADVLYDICESNPYFRFIIRREGSWLALVSFVGMKGYAVVAYNQQLRKTAAKPRPAQETDQPGTGDDKLGLTGKPGEVTRGGQPVETINADG